MLRFCLMLLFATPAVAQTPVLLALRANNWPLATSLASADPDPLAIKLVDFIRLLNPGQASARELADFMAAHPGWPDQATLEKRYGEALVLEADGRVAAGLCRARPPVAAPALLRCADAVAGDAKAAAKMARAAWVAGLNGSVDEAALLARWSGALSQADEVARFDRLLGSDLGAARRELGRLDGAARAVAAARLAFRANDGGAMGLLGAVPAGARGDGALVLAEMRYLRRGGEDGAALGVWRDAVMGAEAAAPVGHRAAFWAERDALARHLVGSDPASAYALADDGLLGPEQAVDALFLAGWIALERLHDPVRARAKFQALADVSRSAITQARAWYWLGRAAVDKAGAQAAYAKAAAWPLTFYGQLAARASGVSEAGLQAAIAGQRDPPVGAAEAASFGRSEAARAAGILAGWQDPRRGAAFLVQAVQAPASLGVRALAAGLALKLGMPDVAVVAARLAGRDGGVLPQDGWPVPYRPPGGAVPAALALAVMRQESSFDPVIVSPAGAHGLMQLMERTAVQVARAQHVAAGPLSDPAVNMRLGTAYLAELVDRFAGCLACAVAAYNAGPNRVGEWVAANGDPAGASEAVLVDWIEMIPFAETRNYVERVLENDAVYAGR